MPEFNLKVSEIRIWQMVFSGLSEEVAQKIYTANKNIIGLLKMKK